MFSARIAIRLPDSFMVPPSGFARGLREKGSDQWAQRAAAALGARGLRAVVLADRHGQAHFLVAAVAEVFVDGHGDPPIVPGRWRTSIGDVADSTPLVPESNRSCRHADACATSQRAVRNSRASPWRGPTSCTPSGRPLAPRMSGTVTAGRPHIVQIVQNMGSPVDSRPSGAVPVAAVVRIAS